MIGLRNSSLWSWIVIIVIVGCSLSATELALADGPPVQWQKTFGGDDADYGRSVQQTADGGFIIAGSTSYWVPDYEEFMGDVYLIKTEPNGNSQWEKTFGGSYSDYGESVQQTTDDGYIIAGYTSYWHPFFNKFMYDVYLIKTEPNGTKQWQKTFGGFDYLAWGSSVQQTADGGYIIAGSTGSFSTRDVYLVKTEPNGTMQWQNTFGVWQHDDRGACVQQTSDGGYIIAGNTESFGTGDSDVYLIKTEPNGNSQWEKTFGEIYDDYGESVQQTTDGGYIIAGISEGADGDPNVYLVKTDPNGNSDWEKSFGGYSYVYEWGSSVQQISDGGYIIAGLTESFGAGISDVYLIKTDPNGNSQWQKTFGRFRSDYGESVQQTADGGYIIAGSTYSFGARGYDVYLIKLCPEGTLSGDLNCDGTVNYKDVDILISQWLQPRSISNPHADIYGVGDGIVDFLDYSTQAEDFGKSSLP